MKLRIVSIMLMFCGLAACATSPGFKFGVKTGADLVANRTIAYATADTTNPIAGQTITDAQALLAADSTQSNITLSAFQPAWAKVEPVYIKYINSDTTLTAPDVKFALNTPPKLDNLIIQETARQGAFLGGLFTTTQPSGQ